MAQNNSINNNDNNEDNYLMIKEYEKKIIYLEKSFELLVQLNNNVFGVYKENSLKPETTYIDDYEIIKSDIAELFDIEHEVTRRIVDDERNIGVFTELNYRKNI